MLEKTTIELFESEFGSLTSHFKRFDFTECEARKSQEDKVWHPGVYVWYSESQGIIRVGKSFTNSRKRALEHIRDNTGGVMQRLEERGELRLQLFNLKEFDSTDAPKLHWVAALEVLFEHQLKIHIPSKRIG